MFSDHRHRTAGAVFSLINWGWKKCCLLKCWISEQKLLLITSSDRSLLNSRPRNKTIGAMHFDGQCKTERIDRLICSGYTFFFETVQATLIIIRYVHFQFF
ncbi:hypothetical protein PVAP13_3NG177493 [Panicum virgatum]|uniref:Uncharacterized protein n=1 Tax=Panicum virgatum TaxID=38727 RepID=A0A8T0TXQ3_PANVG|nr:hypothetical protein PVAP13_3NG177493 [Panicum virgatum]